PRDRSRAGRDLETIRILRLRVRFRCSSGRGLRLSEHPVRARRQRGAAVSTGGAGHTVRRQDLVRVGAAGTARGGRACADAVPRGASRPAPPPPPPPPPPLPPLHP